MRGRRRRRRRRLNFYLAPYRGTHGSFYSVPFNLLI